MVKLSLILCVLTVFALVGVKSVSSETKAPTPSKDCSTIVFSMADCLSFVTNGSKLIKAEGGCCSGLKTVVKTDAQCLCEAFKSSSQLGIVLNVTKALTLPSVCGVHAPSISKCGLSAAGSAPAQYPQAPSPSPTSSKQGSPTPAPAPESGNGTPSPAPAQSHASSTSTVSFLTLFASLVVASCFSYSY